MLLKDTALGTHLPLLELCDCATKHLASATCCHLRPLWTFLPVGVAKVSLDQILVEIVLPFN